MEIDYFKFFSFSYILGERNKTSKLSNTFTKYNI